MFSSELWLPSSIWLWRKEAETSSRVWTSFQFTYFHVLAGIVLYFVLRPLLLPVASDNFLFWIFTVSVLLLGVSLRELGLRKRPLWKMNGKAVLTVLGPSEIIIPILLKTEAAGVSLLYPVVVFTAGALLSGMSLMVSGSRSWDNPYELPYEVSRGPVWTYASITLTLLAFSSSFVYL